MSGLSVTDLGCPVPGWGFLSEGLGWELGPFLHPPADPLILSSPCPGWRMDSPAPQASQLWLCPSLAHFPPAQPLPGLGSGRWGAHLVTLWMTLDKFLSLPSVL